MKMPLFRAGLMATCLFVWPVGSRAAPLGGRFHGNFAGHRSGPTISQSRGFSGGGFHPGFAGRQVGSAFSIRGPRPGWPHVSREFGIRPEFAFRHDRRFFFRHHRPRFVSVFNFGAFGVSYCYPYDYGYPYDYSYDEAGAGYDGQYWNDVAVAVQSELARRGYYHQAPTGGAISSDNSQPQGSSYGPHYADTSYGVATAGEQQTHFRPEPNKPAAPRADPPRANASRPATLAAAVPAAHGSVLDRLVLVSWLADSRKDVIFVEDTETNEVHQITSEPNKDHLRIVEMHLNANPKLTEVVISNGREQGPVKFRFETPTAETSPASPAPLVKDAPGQTPTE